MAGGEWTIQLIQTTPADLQLQVASNWVSEVKKELSEVSVVMSQSRPESIYRIPWSLKKLRRSAYQPQMVSMGPYHRGERQLAAMEKHKKRAFLRLVERSEKPIDCYVDKLAPEVENLMDSYDQLDGSWKEDSKAFLKMMMIDGCFILELMRSATAKPDVLREMGYDEGNDPVFSNHGKLYFTPYLRRDMLMLENQLPLRLLKIILAVEEALPKPEQLTELILKFVGRWEPSRNIQGFENCCHILDMYRKSLLLETEDRLPCRKEEDAYIRSATELTEAGIRFEKSKTINLNDISFRGGVLKLPRITVDDTLESEYLNLMAFERFHVDAGNEVTAYVFFMDRLIDSAKDVSLLHWRGILQNSLGSDKAVAKLFNSLSTDACLDHSSSLGIVHRDVAVYCRSPLPSWIAYAKHNYFTNPWVGLSILAAIFLFALTGVQTLYSVLAYYK
ncbi:hypothetical protein C2S53_003601 [Perilla frutescens var. hirtella]|uniref:Uncharacterized protein n=1 Tax=Perilla frutescens var. hirtella TaxID=608512 RepID=A0AAD4P159_PERFH|nr:hypothetical protein C2S51_009954 [Perilla frutescens var. frutescens]KAH6822774.1 hypothetical protein C2S53_003601 [Perilla frutescens var. hirtella]